MGCARTFATMHPSRYLALIEGFPRCSSRVHQIDDQSVALRLVSLTDRLYDAGIPVITSGPGRLDLLGEMLAGATARVSASDVPAGRADKRAGGSPR